MTARPHCFAASLATRCQRRARSRQRLSTRARKRDSSRSKQTRPSWIRSGESVKRRTDELEGGPTLCRDRRARSEAVAAERGLEADRLRVEDAAEQEGASGCDVAGVARRQPEVRRGQGIGYDERLRRSGRTARGAGATA